MWEIIPQITTPLALIAYGLGIFVYYRISKEKSDREKLAKVPEADQAKLIAALENKYMLTTDNLTRDQKYALLKQTITERSKNKTKQLYLFGFLAILLSFVTIFTFIQPSSDTNEASKKDMYNGYYLGSSFSKSFFQHQSAVLNTGIWTDSEVSEMKSAALLSLTDAKGYADLLGLKLDMETILTHYQPDNEETNVYGPIERRIEGNYTKKVSSSFKLGFWTFWASARSQMVANTNSSADFLNTYNTKIVSSINQFLVEVGINDTGINTQTDINNILTEMNQLRMKLKDFLTGEV